MKKDNKAFIYKWENRKSSKCYYIILDKKSDAFVGFYSGDPAKVSLPKNHKFMLKIKKGMYRC